MAKDKITVDFASVESYAGGLKTKAESFNSDLNNNGNLTSSFSSLINSGLVPNYFSDYSNYFEKIKTFMNNLSDGIMKYHTNLSDIEGYVRIQDASEETVQLDKNPEKTSYTPENIIITNSGNVSVNGETGGATITQIRIPAYIILESGYGKLPIYTTLPELNVVLQNILSKFGITLPDLLSGKFNPTMTDIIAQSPNLSVLISTITQMEAIVLQGYLRELSSYVAKPPLYPNAELFLKYLASSKGIPFSALLTDTNYAIEIKDSLIKHKDSLIILNDLSLTNDKDIQTELNNIIYGTNKPQKDIDPVTKEMLSDYLKVVSQENNLSLKEMLTDEKYAELSKKALESFVNKILYGEDTDIPFAEIIKEVQPILDDKGTTVEDILSGKENDTLTDIIENTEDSKVVEIVKNMDDEALQDYIEEIVENKHPTIIEKPVIKEIIKTIVINKEIIRTPSLFDNSKNEIKPLEKPIVEEIEIPTEENLEDNNVEEKPIIVDDTVKEILQDSKYAPQIKETVKNNNSLGWLALLPIAGIGIVPLYSALKNKKEKENDREEIYYDTEPKITKIIVNEDFSNFAISNSLTEEDLLSGANFEVLTMYLSKLDSLQLVLNIFSTIKDEVLQSYLYEIYSLKYEHIWSKNSMVLKVIFNSLVETGKKQNLEIENLLANTNYVVWVKSSMIDLSRSYQKFEEDIKYSGGFVTFINNILNKTIIIPEEYLNLLKSYLETNSKNEKLNLSSYLEANSNNESKLKIFSIINFGDGNNSYSLGFANLIEMLNDDKSNYGNENLNNNMIIETSGYLELLFNSTEDQIYKAIDKILKRYNINKEDLFNGSREDVLDVLVEKVPNIVILLILLLNFDSSKLQQYLYKLNKEENNKFLLFLFKHLTYLAKSENTTIDALLTTPSYTNLIKESLTNLKTSVIKIYALSKKDDDSLNDEINKLLFTEDPSVFGIDKITINLLKDYLSSSADKMKMGLNSLLDINSIKTLRKLLDSLIGNIIYLNFKGEGEDEKVTKQNSQNNISSINLQNNNQNIIAEIRSRFSQNFIPELKSKIIKYISILGRDTNLSTDDYLDSKEFSNFITINFENSNLVSLLYNNLLSQSSISFEINSKLTELASKNNLNIEELLSLKGTNFIVESIIKEKNILYTLEVLINLEDESYSKIIKELNLIKQNTNLKEIFEYIDSHLKRPVQKSMEDYLNESNNLKNTWMLLLKILIMLLITLYLSNKEEVL